MCRTPLSLSLSFAVKLRGIPCSAPAIPFITSSYLRRPSIIGRPILLLLDQTSIFTKPATLVILILHSLGSPEFLLQNTFHFAISRLDNSGT
ncbi:hypothetical protein HYQ46_013205 [Verticillium longisporum]|nr:hypothetical protein HYQ46_013205 [Verticillium longisporum]